MLHLAGVAGGARVKPDARVSRVQLGADGRVRLPAAIRLALGLRPGDELLVRLVEGEVRLSTPSLGIAHTRAVVKRAARGGSLVARLQTARRQEVAREPRRE